MKLKNIASIIGVKSDINDINNFNLLYMRLLAIIPSGTNTNRVKITKAHSSIADTLGSVFSCFLL